MITITTKGNGVLFNGSLVDAKGFVVSRSGDRAVISHKDSGLTGSDLITKVEVDDETYEDYEELVDALSTILFKANI